MEPSNPVYVLSREYGQGQITRQYLQLDCIEEQQQLVRDGSVDMKGKRVSRAQTGGWKACAYIIGNELSERLAYYGIASNLVTYLTSVLHEGLASAAKTINNWAGVTTIIPLLGAFFADAYWGRYRTIVALSVVYVLGLVLLTVTVSLPTLKPPHCQKGRLPCPKATSAQLGFFFFSLYLISIGSGGLKPCLEAFGADQFDEEDSAEKRQKSSFFNWWYVGLCTGALAAFTVLVYIQDNVGWGLGFALPAVAMAIALCTFLSGTYYYRHKLPAGSPLTQIAQVFIAAIRKYNIPVPSDITLLHHVHDHQSLRLGRRQLLHTDGFTFFDKAAVIEDVDSDSEDRKLGPWNLCTVTQVEEVKLVLRIIPIWLTTFAYGVVFAQVSTFFTKQGSTMNANMGEHFKIPPASLQSFTTLAIIFLLPVYDRIFVPMARRLTGNERGISMLQRIGVGYAFSIISIVIAALTEVKRLNAAKQHGLLNKPNATIPLSIFWLLPQYILMGVSDVFAIVGQQEFFYDQVPDTMRSLGMALYLGAVGVANFMSSSLISIVDRVTTRGGHPSWFMDNLNTSHLDYFYWLLAVFSGLNLSIYILVTQFYIYKKPQSIAASLDYCTDSAALELGVSDGRFVENGSRITSLRKEDEPEICFVGVSKT